MTLHQAGQWANTLPTSNFDQTQFKNFYGWMIDLQRQMPSYTILIISGTGMFLQNTSKWTGRRKGVIRKLRRQNGMAEQKVEKATWEGRTERRQHGMAEQKVQKAARDGRTESWEGSMGWQNRKLRRQNGMAEQKEGSMGWQNRKLRRQNGMAEQKKAAWDSRTES